MEQKEVDKIEQGEWLRTNTGEIGKVFKVELAKEEREKYPNNPYKGYWRDKYVTDVRRGYCTRQVIKKHSKNIIDLIEVGDYVNGMLVVSVTEIILDDKSIKEKIVFVNRDENCTLKPLQISNEDIKTIVTKEKFASMEYRLEV